jgi:heme exporter protein D
MIWSSTSEFWAMGGYGVYVWGSMGVSAALLTLEVWLVRMGRKQALDAVCEAMDAEPDVRGSANGRSVSSPLLGGQYPSGHPVAHPTHITTGAPS